MRKTADGTRQRVGKGGLRADGRFWRECGREVFPPGAVRGMRWREIGLAATSIQAAPVFAMLTLRPTRKLARRLGIDPGRIAQSVERPFADWCVHDFMVGRYRHLLIANTRSLLPMVICARGITDHSTLIARLLGAMGEQLRADGRGFFHERFIAPESGTVRFAPIDDRAILGSINELVFQSKVLLTSGDLAPFDLSRRLAEVPMSVLKWRSPTDVFPTMESGGDWSGAAPSL